MHRIILLWLGIFILAGLTLAISAQFLISPIWVVNAFSAYFCLRLRKQLKNIVIIGLFSTSAIFAAALLFDGYQSVMQKLLLSSLSGLQVSLFVWVYYVLIDRMRQHDFKYRQTILLTFPNIVSSLIAGLLFILIPKQGERYLEFLDYFLEQVSTGLAVVCILTGMKSMKQVEMRDYALLALALFIQYFISVSPIFYNCFILPIFLVYFAMRYSVIRFSYLVGLLSLVCAIYVSIPLAGQFWQQNDLHFLSRLSVYRSGIAMSIVIYLFMCEIQNLNKSLYYHLARASFNDELTGLKNRRFMREKVLARHQLENGLLLLIDIDDFKKINDHYGHHIGDLILKKFTHLIEKNMPVDAQIFRWGGEEFLVLIQSIQTTEDATQLCQAFINATKDVYFDCDAEHVISSLSVGAVQFKTFSEKNYHHIINYADELLYKAKASGKKCYFLAQDEYH
ncbi:GGDEF domain-containing protein [Acinetobacter sp. MD2]|uniref:GGDEF domain-containing protein n=1 Tax=Acinetobacter sp. MD2 TaxID=2600066 RepID=UPI002D1F76EA|nr:GGDEF domain-containing protein [Acinetobacter sp. MD2]MEB3766860.1 GGDEF domain-containing protein [Acinetobacter sp. MD2]